MKINFTKKQYKHLLDLIYLGDWVANSSKIGEEIDADYEALADYVYSFAKSFGYEDYIVYDKEYNTHFPTNKLEEELRVTIEENDTEVFWTELSSHLAHRDLQKELKSIVPPADNFIRLLQIEEKYNNEFEENGLDNVVIQRKTN
jgi:adenine specific DNA methylase Mod